MPGHFAHILMVEAISNDRLSEIPEMSPSVRSALTNYLPYCKLGAVSPDCGACTLQDAAKGWSDWMHYAQPMDFVRFAIPRLLELPFNRAEGRAAVAWLFGYVAHLVADCTVHPVLNASGYDFNVDPTAHRKCEFSQDAYIVQRRLGQELNGSDLLPLCGMEACDVRHAMSPELRTVLDFWSQVLLDAPRDLVKRYVRLPAKSATTSMWVATYLNVIGIAAKGKTIPKVLGMTYPASNAVESRYVENLLTPKAGVFMDYGALFNLACDHIIEVWTVLNAALNADDAGQFSLANTNLDTGRQLPSGPSLYWA